MYPRGERLSLPCPSRVDEVVRGSTGGTDPHGERCEGEHLGDDGHTPGLPERLLALCQT